MARREQKQHVQDMLAQAIVHKSLDMERARQVQIRRKLEEIAKIELVRRVQVLHLCSMLVRACGEMRIFFVLVMCHFRLNLLTPVK